MAIGSTSGTSGPGATSRRSISEPTTRWRSRCGPRTIPFANTGSWALWSTHEPRRLDLDLVARRRQVPHREDGYDPARTGVQGPAPTAPAGDWRSAAAGD